MIPELMGHRKAVGYWLSLNFFFPFMHMEAVVCCNRHGANECLAGGDWDKWSRVESGERSIFRH